MMLFYVLVYLCMCFFVCCWLNLLHHHHQDPNSLSDSMTEAFVMSLLAVLCVIAPLMARFSGMGQAIEQHQLGARNWGSIPFGSFGSFWDKHCDINTVFDVTDRQYACCNGDVGRNLIVTPPRIDKVADHVQKKVGQPHVCCLHSIS